MNPQPRWWRILQKAPWATALGAFLFACLGGCSPQADADCVLGGQSIEAQVRHVSDGDSLVLSDGRRVRLIGVNTPELARSGRPAQPLAEEALRFTRQFLGDGEIEMIYDKDRRDRYGRILAHVYNRDGDSLEAALLSAGFGFQVAIAPNIALAECLSSREEAARAAGRGVWDEKTWPILNASDIRPGQGGFVRLRGTVRKVDRNRYLWLELDGPVAVRLPLDGDFGQLSGGNWQDRQIEVRGWLIDRGLKYLSRFPQNKRWLISADTKYTLDISTANSRN